MNKFITIFFAIPFSLYFTSSAQGQIKFSDYPVEVYKGKKTILKTDEHVDFRLGSKVNDPPVDFAGIYSYFAIGCGTACIAHKFYGVVTGKEYGFDLQLNPDVDCDDGSKGEVVVRPHSKLLIIKGLKGRTGSSGRCEVRFFIESEGNLKPLN